MTTVYSPILILFFSILLVAQSKDVPIPRYNVNLDLAPEERWSQVAKDYKDEINSLVAFFILSYSPVYEMLSIMAGGLQQYLPEPYASEINGFAKYTKLTAGEVIFLNMLYEITAFDYGVTGFGQQACTSIVATMDSGQIIHGRNLEYELDQLRKMTIIVDFQESGKTVYTGTTFAGLLGLLTAQKPNNFTISLNERNHGDWRSNVIEATKIGTQGIISFLIRDVVADPDSDFEKAVEMLSSTQIIAPCYIIVGGLSGDEGAIITQNRTMGIDVWRLNGSTGRWFLVETNYDHWELPPIYDNRRDSAIKGMNATGQAALNKDSLFKILSTPPVLNNRTVYTTIMSASNPTLLEGWIRIPDK